MTAEQRTKIEKKYKDALAAWKSKKFKYREIMDQLEESLETKFKKLREEAGIETDSDHELAIEGTNIVKKRKAPPPTKGAKKIKS